MRPKYTENKAMKKRTATKKEPISTPPRGDLANYYFHQGTNFRAYEHLGVHKTTDGYVFRVWHQMQKKYLLWATSILGRKSHP